MNTGETSTRQSVRAMRGPAGALLTMVRGLGKLESVPPQLLFSPPRLFSAVLSDAVPLVLSRQMLLAFAQSLPQLSHEVQLDVAT
jgi:hypothetical protein